MGGPSYQQPSPVKRSDGTSVLWNWNTQKFEDYDVAAAEADKQRIQAHPAGSPDAYGERGGMTGTAPSPPTPATVPATGNTRMTIQQRRKPGGPQPYGAGSSLLTSRNDR